MEAISASWSEFIWQRCRSSWFDSDRPKLLPSSLAPSRSLYLPVVPSFQASMKKVCLSWWICSSNKRMWAFWLTWSLAAHPSNSIHGFIVSDFWYHEDHQDGIPANARLFQDHNIWRKIVAWCLCAVTNQSCSQCLHSSCLWNSKLETSFKKKKDIVTPGLAACWLENANYQQ